MLLKKLIEKFFLSDAKTESVPVIEKVPEIRTFDYIHHALFNHYEVEVMFTSVMTYIDRLVRINNCLREDLLFHRGFAESPKNVITVGRFFLSTEEEYIDSEHFKRKLFVEIRTLIAEHERMVRNEDLTDTRRKNIASSRTLAIEASRLLEKLEWLESSITKALNE